MPETMLSAAEHRLGRGDDRLRAGEDRLAPETIVGRESRCTLRRSRSSPSQNRPSPCRDRRLTPETTRPRLLDESPRPGTHSQRWLPTLRPPPLRRLLGALPRSPHRPWYDLIRAAGRRAGRAAGGGAEYRPRRAAVRSCRACGRSRLVHAGERDAGRGAAQAPCEIRSRYQDGGDRGRRADRVRRPGISLECELFAKIVPATGISSRRSAGASAREILWGGVKRTAFRRSTIRRGCRPGGPGSRSGKVFGVSLAGAPAYPLRYLPGTRCQHPWLEPSPSATDPLRQRPRFARESAGGGRRTFGTSASSTAATSSCSIARRARCGPR